MLPVVILCRTFTTDDESMLSVGQNDMMDNASMLSVFMLSRDQDDAMGGAAMLSVDQNKIDAYVEEPEVDDFQLFIIRETSWTQNNLLTSIMKEMGKQYSSSSIPVTDEIDSLLLMNQWDGQRDKPARHITVSSPLSPLSFIVSEDSWANFNSTNVKKALYCIPSRTYFLTYENVNKDAE